MGKKTDHVSTSRLRHAVDFSLADPADKDAGNDDVITRRIKTIREKAMLEEVIEGTTGRHRYQPSWTQRVLSWFRRG